MRKLLLMMLCLCVLALPVCAEEPETTGVCGETVTWTYEEGLLLIEGQGAMDDFEEEAPWEAFREKITRVELKGGVTYIGARSFKDYDNLTTVDFGTALYEIGTEAFMSCDGLTVISLPASFKVFGESSFNSCSNLNAIHCSGKFPSFRMNCLWNTYGKIYYPADKPWSTEYIGQLETAFKGRIEFLASDGTDHYQPAEETEPVTEVPTEAPTDAPTEAPTEAPTAPPTEAPAPTEAPTKAPTELPATAPQTEPPAPPRETQPAPEEKPESKSWIGLVIIGAVLGFVLTGSIAVFAGGRRGRYSKKRRNR